METNQPITQQEIDRLRAPFPLASHSIREGNKVRNGQGIQWFVYVEKTEVENRLNEVFPGEWGSSQPVLTPIGNGVAATISITIRGITRGNTGEDSNGTEKAKGATTDAFRRAAADWGVAKYVWEMEFSIYTDAYPDKDWKARDAREKEAFDKFAVWYKKKFQNITPIAPQSNEKAVSSDLTASDHPDTTAVDKTPSERLGTPSGQRVGNSTNGKPGYKDGDLMNAVLKTIYGNNPIHMKKSLKKLNDAGLLGPWLTLEQAIDVVKNRKEDPEAKGA